MKAGGSNWPHAQDAIVIRTAMLKDAEDVITVGDG